MTTLLLAFVGLLALCGLCGLGLLWLELYGER